MPVLYVLLGIVLFFVIAFSLPFTVIIEYGEKTFVTLKYLFIKIPVVDPTKPKKGKKKKPEKKKETPAEEPPTDAPAEPDTKKTKDKTKPQGNSLIKQLYLDQGYDGLEKMLRAVGNSLGGFFGKLYKTFTIDELYITMVTAGSDAADTAIKHGKLCAWLYPILGKLVSTCKVKKYDFDISVDFLATEKKAEAYVRFHVIPIRITNAAIVLALQLAFKVLFKILFSKKKSDKSKKVISQSVSEETNSSIVAEIADKENITNKDKDGVS